MVPQGLVGGLLVAAPDGIYDRLMLAERTLAPPLLASEVVAISAIDRCTRSSC